MLVKAPAHAALVLLVLLVLSPSPVEPPPEPPPAEPPPPSGSLFASPEPPQPVPRATSAPSRVHLMSRAACFMISTFLLCPGVRASGGRLAGCAPPGIHVLTARQDARSGMKASHRCPGVPVRNTACTQTDTTVRGHHANFRLRTD